MASYYLTMCCEETAYRKIQMFNKKNEQKKNNKLFQSSYILQLTCRVLVEFVFNFTLKKTPQK